MSETRFDMGREKKLRYLIIDWAGVDVWPDKRFTSIADAKRWLSEQLGDDYETDRSEYHIYFLGPRPTNINDLEKRLEEKREWWK